MCGTGVDVVAVRLWFPNKRALPQPSSVVGGGVPSDLPDVGWTFYHLNELHDELRGEEQGHTWCTHIPCTFPSVHC